MVIENQIPKTEMVYELKNKIPSFEEFVKTYENDGNVNYDDLNSGDVGEVKGMGLVLVLIVDVQQKNCRDNIDKINFENKKEGKIALLKPN